MPCKPQKQPPASTAVWSPVASVLGVSSAGGGITLLTASAPACWQAHPQAASARIAAMVLILVSIVVSLERAGARNRQPTGSYVSAASRGLLSGAGLAAISALVVLMATAIAA